MRVLVVDDHESAAEALQLVLEMAGHEVRSALDGEEALTIAVEFEPEVVVLDIGLPGIDGYEVARRLRQQPGCRTSVLVAMTGYGHEEDRRRSKEAGFDHHLVKPVNPADLLSLVNSIPGR